MTIDNFDIIRQHLTFEKAKKFDAESKKLKEINDTYDRYIIHIIKRAKDSKGKIYGVNESNRLIKTYEISSLEYFDKKKSHIIDLCESNGARAYILPQVRSTHDCLKFMLKQIVDNLENPTIKFQHILRSALCSMHKSRDPKWILDLDNDEMYGWTVDEIITLLKENLKACGKDTSNFYIVKTRNGMHIVTTPFNTKAFSEKCPMMFEGAKRGVNLQEALELDLDLDIKEMISEGIKNHLISPMDLIQTISDRLKYDPRQKEVVKELETLKKDIPGWLHKDGMTLLYVVTGDKDEA